ncbi:MAG: DUF4446 family protein [Sarcina sp.]
MNNIISMVEPNLIYIVLGIAAFAVLEFILILILFGGLSKTKKKYKKMMRGENNKNLEEIIESSLEKINKAEASASTVVDRFEALEGTMKNCVQKVGVIRYKAFEDVGSDLSFSVALLDGNNDGVMITGIYGRMESTTYAKPIDKGISRYELSEEESKALAQAINK